MTKAFAKYYDTLATSVLPIENRTAASIYSEKMPHSIEEAKSLLADLEQSFDQLLADVNFYDSGFNDVSEHIRIKINQSIKDSSTELDSIADSSGFSLQAQIEVETTILCTLVDLLNTFQGYSPISKQCITEDLVQFSGNISEAFSAASVDDKIGNSIIDDQEKTRLRIQAIFNAYRPATEENITPSRENRNGHTLH